jgi:CelD/BcsL family acetyltransferase involved in cellulose biosynthesis
MMIEIDQLMRIDPSDERWKAFVEADPLANIFHHPSWVGLLAECYGYQPFILGLSADGERITAGLPLLNINSPLTGRRWVSLPFTDYCNPLYCDDEAYRQLVEALTHLSQDKNTPQIEVRWALADQASVQNHSQFVKHSLNLDQDIESISKSLHRTQRQNIKTAEKNNLQIVRGENLDSLRVFYHLHCLTRRRQGVPVQPWRFFELLYNRLIKSELGFILLAYAGDQCLAAGLFLHWQKTLVYKYASSGDTGQDLRPNHLLTWTAIRWGCDNGYKIFDFGRTDIENEGLRTFKNRWGAEEAPLSYSYFPAKTIHSSKGRISSLMHVILRNSPLWVCRSTGELLYKHFG